MATRIFLSRIGWDSDPAHNPESDVCKAKKAFAAGETFPVINWTCSNIQNIQVGDKAYFKRVGNKPRGFFARGFVISAEPQLRWVDSINYGYLSEAYRDIFDGQFTVDIEWIEVVDYDKLLDTSELKKNPKFKGAFFDPRRSGSSFNEEYIDSLDRYWKAHLSKLSKQGYCAEK